MAELAKVLCPKHLLKLLKSEKDSISALSLFDSAISNPNYTPTPSVFHHILRRISQSPKLLPHVSRIVNLIQAKKCTCSEDIPLIVIKAYSNSSMVDHALDLFQRMTEIFGCEPGIRSYNTLLNALAKSNRFSRADLFFRNFRKMGVFPNLETYNILIKILCKKKQFDRVKEMLNWMSERGMFPDAFSYGTLINGLVKSGEMSSALKVFDEMFEKGLTPDVMCYNILIDGFFKKGDFLEAIVVWERLVNSSSVYPDVGTYNVMIGGFFKCGKFNESLKIWNRMKENERQMDLFTYSMVINVFCELGNVEGGSGGGAEAAGSNSILKPSNWKTRICNKWEQTGYCPFGSKCHFAHGAAELHRYGGGLVDIDAKDSPTAMDSNKQGIMPSKIPVETVVASAPSAAHSDGYHVGVPSQRLPGVIPRTGQRPFQKWKGPDKISRIYGDWIDDNE